MSDIDKIAEEAASVISTTLKLHKSRLKGLRLIIKSACEKADQDGWYEERVYERKFGVAQSGVKS